MQRQPCGFTLIEVILVIVITGIIASIGAKIMAVAFKSYFDLSHQASLIDQGDIARRKLALDFQQALPNSIRIGCQDRCIEMLHTKDSGRYRAATVLTDDILDFTQPDTSFEILGPLNKTTIGTAHSIVTGNGSTDCANNNADCLVIFNTGTGLQNAYNNNNKATIRNILPLVDPTILTFISSNLPANIFPAPSPKQRFYIVDTPILYLCDLNNGTLIRYHRYPIISNPNLVNSHNELVLQGAEFHLLSSRIQACRFQFSVGGAIQGGLVSIEIRLANDDKSFSLFDQVQVGQIP